MNDKPQRPAKPNIFRSSRWKQDQREIPPSAVLTTKEKPCKIAEICGNCAYINHPYQDALSAKYQTELQILKDAVSLQGVTLQPPVESKRQLGYRTHAKLAVRSPKDAVNAYAGQRFSIGLFQAESHNLVDIWTCPLHRESINDLVVDLRDELNKSPLQPYDEKTNDGDLRYLTIRASHQTREVMLTFVVRDASVKSHLLKIVLNLRHRDHNISAAFMNVNSDVTNAIFGPSTVRIAGADGLRERLCELDFEIGPTSFFQINPWQAETIYNRVIQIAGTSNGEVAWDLYCGVGQITMQIARAGYRTIGVEENPQAIADAEKNADRNQIKPRPSFLAGRVESVQNTFPTWALSPKLIVANPSRKGLAPSVREMLGQTLDRSPHCRMVYVSCDIGTLGRDLADLVSKGYKLRQIEAYDMFPFTEKLEWLAILHP